MTESLQEQAERAVETAKQRGASAARATLTRTHECGHEWRDGKIERLEDSTRMELSVALFVDGRYSLNTTSDLRPEALAPFLDETIATTRAIAKDEHRHLPDPSTFESRFAGDLELYDANGRAALSAPERLRIVQELEAAVRQAPGADRLVSVTTSAGFEEKELALATSNGMSAAQQTTLCSLSAEATVRGEGNAKPADYAEAKTRHARALPSLGALGAEALRRAAGQIGAKPEKSGRYPFVVENRVARRLVWGLLVALDGQALQQQRSFLAEQMDQVVGSPLFDITDDPLFHEGLASRSFDAEGMSTRVRHIFEKGRLRSYFLDTYYASKLTSDSKGKRQYVPTTARGSNLLMPGGTRSVEELCRAMGRGILITDFSGGNSNSATGKFSVGVSGYFVDGGKVVRPVQEMNLAGSHTDLWRKLVELGNDPFPYAATRLPSLRFDPVDFSGT